MSELRPSIIVFVLLTVLTGVLYPLVVTGVGQLLFNREANGSIIRQGARAVGSELLGQSFTSPKYFWSRPSATAPQPYNGGASSGSNQGPINPALAAAVRDRIAVLRAADPDNRLPVPVDLVTASGSGLDPHISPAGAAYQVNRVAKARGLTAAEVNKVMQQAAEGRTFGILGEPRVNVVRLNLLLDDLPAR
ncbi:MAG TPA: potassium-transporting ATPase subunit KdpC [Steroidobacteraceae bacterium]|nr:potassium-transporting ATPase subunit KdpC [Steroidobacteraceae bacterium]